MNETTAQDTIDIRAYWEPIWKRKWWILIFVVAVTAATYFYVASKAKEYAASTTVLVTHSNAEELLSGRDLPLTVRDTQNVVVLTQSRRIASLVRQELNQHGFANVKVSSLNTGAATDSDVVTINVRANSAAGAAAAANAYADALTQERTRTLRQELADANQQTQARLDAIEGNSLDKQRQRDSLETRIRQTEAVSASLDPGLAQLDVAVANPKAVAPNPRRASGFALILSLLFAMVVAYTVSLVDRRVRTPDDLEQLYGLPVLGTVPRVGDPSPVGTTGAAFAPELREPMRLLRLQLSLQGADSPIRTLLVTSAMPSEGKSTIVRNLALAMYEAGSRVVIVEADLRAPSLAPRLGIDGRYGLTDVIAGEVRLDEALVEVPMPQIDQELPPGQLFVLPAGTPASNAPAVLGSGRMSDTLAQLSERFDILLVDSPPLLAVADTLSLLPAVNGVLLVGRVGLTSREAIRRVRELLERSPGGPVLGLVVDDVNAQQQGYGYGYGYGYGKYGASNPPSSNGASAGSKKERTSA